MANYIQTKVRVEKTLEDGMVKNVTETYLVEAESLTEAEARIVEETQGVVKSASSYKIAEVVTPRYSPTDNTYYKAVVELSYDELRGKETRKSHGLLVQANGIADALESIKQRLSGTMLTYEIKSIAKTPILDVL